MEHEKRTIRQKAREEGIRGEKFAAAYLSAKGYTLLETNFRNRHREIDLIVRRGKTVVFVEVKTRKPDPIEQAALSVDRRKQRLLCSAASKYLQTCPPGTLARFDVICVECDKNGTFRLVDHIRSAFNPFGG